MNRWRTREFAYKRDVERLLKEVRQENEKQTELIKYLIENLGQEEKQRLEGMAQNLTRQLGIIRQQEEERTEMQRRESTVQTDQLKAIEKLLKMLLLNSLSDEVEQ
ncbi:hypothetical protein CLS_09290 [[Clostridium] cf. saccharolyticum K10]|nr:hypothetical protein CLS_09290 [[Clostridium] cf. saccharolyticum K10]